jgi:3',5'-cyclic-AMP phosphodiesterase
MRISGIEAAPFHRLPYSLSASGKSPRCELPFFRAVVDGLPDSLDAIVATADLQGVADAGGTLAGLGEAVSVAIERLRGDGRLPAPDRTVVVLAGDLHARAGEDDVLPVWRAFGSVCRWVAGVAGNHDRIGPVACHAIAREALSDLNAHLLDGATVEVDGIRVGGLSGIISSADGPWHRQESDYSTALSSLMKQRCDLLVLHDGPNVAGTDLPGWPSVRRVLEAAAPVLVIRGHDHWPDPVAELANGTQVLNVEGRVVVLRRRSGGTGEDIS